MSRSKHYSFRRRGKRSEYTAPKPHSPLPSYALAYHEYLDTPDGDYTTLEARVGATIEAETERLPARRRKRKRSSFRTWWVELKANKGWAKVDVVNLTISI